VLTVSSSPGSSRVTPRFVTIQVIVLPSGLSTRLKFVAPMVLEPVQSRFTVKLAGTLLEVRAAGRNGPLDVVFRLWELILAYVAEAEFIELTVSQLV
jgi:hypothetical protein